MKGLRAPALKRRLEGRYGLAEGERERERAGRAAPHCCGLRRCGPASAAASPARPAPLARKVRSPEEEEAGSEQSVRK